jgi:hypothetical protein
VVDVSSVRNILLRIRRVVSGDVILPEDHNLQTDALTALTNVVEAIPEPPPPPTPPPPQVLILSGGDAVNSLCWVGVGNRIGFFRLPFNVKLKQFIFRVEYKVRYGPAQINVVHDGGPYVGSVNIPAYGTGVYVADLGDYLLPANNSISVRLLALEGTEGDIWRWFFNIYAEMTG